MRKLKFLILVAVLLLANLSTGAIAAFAADTNLIANSSAETLSGTTPTGWTGDSWGTNTTSMTVSSDAHTGTHSLSTNVTAYTDGDAKWIPTSVAVSPNSVYTYSSWYKANVATEVDLMYTDTTGAVTYDYLDAPAAATVWTNYTKTFTTPSNAAKVSVLQIVAKKGTLTTDDFSLVKYSAPVAAGTNLIANPSFETANGASPAGWQQDGWGTNTAAFTYDATGRTGKSATVTISKYTDGDAKWTATPATVTAGKSYTYTDYYKSGVATRVVAAFTLSDGTTTYMELAGAPVAATAWTAYTSTFTAPAKAVSLTMYHLLDKVGSLSIDDTDLEVTATTTPPVVTPPATGITIANPSMETASGTLPANWTQEGWGTNTAAFSYENTGHTGSKSVKITMSKYTDGDAKWMFTPITTITSNKSYTFTAWYKGSVNPSVVVQYTLTDGSTYYANLPVVNTVASTTNWQQYNGEFTAPANVKDATIFMLVNQNGWVQTDDYSVASYTPTGFSRGLVSLTFDDAWASDYTQVLPVEKQYGFKNTHYILTGSVNDTADSYMTTAQVKALYAYGDEIGAHTVTHPMLTTLSPTALNTELQQSQATLKTMNGVAPTDFASPYGDYNAAVIAAAKKYYVSHRTVDEGYNSKDNLNLYQLKVQNILNTTTPAQVAAWVKQAQVDKTWLIIVYHEVKTNPDTYDSSIANFKTEMANLSTSGVPVKTVKDAITELTAQK